MLSFLLWVGLAAFAPLSRGEFISTDYESYNGGMLGQHPTHEFYSSNESSPVLQVNTWDVNAISNEASHIFLRHDGENTSSPLVLNAQDLTAVYMNHTAGFEHVFGTRVQENFGKKYLTFWAGTKDDGDGTSNGVGLAYDDSYRLIYNISAQNVSHRSDLHEFEFTGQGTALMIAMDAVLASTSDWPGWKGARQIWVKDNIIQEVGLETNEVVFSWRALDHISPMDSFEPVVNSWDMYHTNSIQKTEAGNYLVSMRHTHSIYLINGKTGEIIWTLGGKRNDFVELAPAINSTGSLAPVLDMAWQHDPRFVPGTNDSELTFFDNHQAVVNSVGRCQSTDACSRGLRVAIDTASTPPTVQILRQYLHPLDIQTISQGSVQLLGEDDDANVFIGWGKQPFLTEHLHSGEAVMDVQFSPGFSKDVPNPLDNYRAYKMNWVATPWWDPSIVLRETSQGDFEAYVSWNGATEVREWVLRGDEGMILSRSKRMGFETRLMVGSTMWLRHLWVEALSENGTVLGASEVLDLESDDFPIITEPDGFEPTDPASNASGEALGPAALGGGLVGLLIVILGFLLRRRRSDYEHLADGEADAGSDVGLDDVHLDLEDLQGGAALEGWKEAPMYFKGHGSGSDLG